MSTATIPARVAILNDAWKSFMLVAGDYKARVTEIQERSLGQLGIKDRFASFYNFSDRCLPDIRDAAKSLVNALACEAEQLLSPAGGRLKIDSNDLEHRFRYDEDRTEFDPLKVWEYLVQTYSPLTAYRQEATRLRRGIVELYRGNSGDPVKRVGGRPVLHMGVYAESYSTNYYGYNSQESIREVVVGLAAVLNWAGLACVNEVEVAKARVLNNLTRGGREQPARHNYTDDILVIPYKSKIEFRISERLFEQLVIFMSEFGSAQESY